MYTTHRKLIWTAAWSSPVVLQTELVLYKARLLSISSSTSRSKWDLQLELGTLKLSGSSQISWPVHSRPVSICLWYEQDVSTNIYRSLDLNLVPSYNRARLYICSALLFFSRQLTYIVVSAFIYHKNLIGCYQLLPWVHIFTQSPSALLSPGRWGSYGKSLLAIRQYTHMNQE